MFMRLAGSRRKLCLIPETCTRANYAWGDWRKESVQPVPANDAKCMSYWEWAVLSLLTGKARVLSVHSREGQPWSPWSSWYGFVDLWVQEALADRYKSPYMDLKAFPELLRLARCSKTSRLFIHGDWGWLNCPLLLFGPHTVLEDPASPFRKLPAFSQRNAITGGIHISEGLIWNSAFSVYAK